MVNKKTYLAGILLITGSLMAQKGKVQTAWRALSDYEETVKDGKPNIAYLATAKEAIDLALANDDTKKLAKTHAYSLRIAYAQFQYNLQEEMKKLEATVADKNQRAQMAYGNTSLSDFEKANNELNTLKDLDPKFLETIQTGIANGASSLDEDELKFAQAVLQMKVEAGNIASGKFNVKKYDEAADYFYKTGFINTIMNKTKDTASFYNACVSASKAKNYDKMLDYNKKMIELKLASAYNYNALASAHMAKGDTTSAFDDYKKGREQFPKDANLLTEETNLFMAKGKSKEALANLKLATEREPKNPFYYIFIGNLYDNMANPKDKTGRDLPKPANFDELFKNAETNYLKAIELKPSNKDFYFDVLFNLGAMYNNYGGMLASRKPEKITDMLRVQKENDEASAVYFKKAIPFLEQALSLRNNDVQTMRALRILYAKTGNTAKATEMTESLKLNGAK
ncbi:MAG: hypothetical protein IT236_09035 [Bacteroidia bacterium]|nr:hypothetical protein [Bacteroidia bacterium]